MAGLEFIMLDHSAKFRLLTDPCVEGMPELVVGTGILHWEDMAIALLAIKMKSLAPGICPKAVSANIITIKNGIS